MNTFRGLRARRAFINQVRARATAARAAAKVASKGAGRDQAASGPP
jgi:hypothetical protein